MKILSRDFRWLPVISSLLLGAAVGSALMAWRNTREAQLFAVMDQTSKVKLHANMIRQLERGDIAGLESAHRDVIGVALAAIDVLTEGDSHYANSKEILEARRLAAEAGIESPQSFAPTQ